MEHFSVSIVQHSDGIATVAYTGLDGSVYRFEVSADRVMLFSARLIDWVRCCMVFDSVCEGR